MFGTGAAYAECGDVSLAVFSWQSAEAMSNVDQFILNNGYGCNATTVAGDTVPTITAMIEKGQPDISSESTPSLLGDVYKNGAARGPNFADRHRDQRWSGFGLVYPAIRG